ncbi:MFS general substrate transporter [Ceraceosorus guamensis]|uniref:MFS general substrate transporter n=1 Tax=Ceraceosorus guamensis TaxID=1522189 RepID=A0A316VSP2_9BASI|nr:MFS general substrate transporter [Ceraceosorus guamensis]PWN40607.1 MFS general substrate transporter [Ceraceosorus guamensis]
MLQNVNVNVNVPASHVSASASASASAHGEANVHQHPSDTPTVSKSPSPLACESRRSDTPFSYYESQTTTRAPSPAHALYSTTTEKSKGSEAQQQQQQDTEKGLSAFESRKGEGEAHRSDDAGLTTCSATALKRSTTTQRAEMLSLPTDQLPTRLPKSTKWTYTILAALVFFNTGFAASAPSGAYEKIVADLGMTSLQGSAVTSVYLAGLVFGPSIWAPLSERRGRKMVNLLSLPLFTCWNVGCALAPNKQTLIVMRFFAGLCGSAPASNSGAWISDVFEPRERVAPMMSYTFSAFLGPILGPIVGGFLADANAWRWIFWLMCIQAMVFWSLCLILQRESYVPVLVVRRASILRQTTGDDLIRAPLEKEPLKVKDVIHTHMLRPLTMLVTEPPVMYTAAWMGFSYGLIFLYLEAFPVVFGKMHGFNAGEVGLSFLPLAVGMVLSFPVVAHYNKRYLRARQAAGKPVPEARLSMTCLSAPCFAIGLFMFGWTSTPNIHWIVPMIAEIPLGLGLIFAFNSLGVYVSECYLSYVASALAAAALSRSSFGAFCPLFGRPAFEWSVPYMCSILGGLCLLVSPVPFYFSKYGPALRRRSKLAIK